MNKLFLSILLILSTAGSLFMFEEKEITPMFNQPLLITSAGQSADIQIANLLAKRAKLKYSLSKMADLEDMKAHKTLVLVLGASVKGLGAAGLNVNQEKKRILLLLETSKKNSIPILCLHLGGEARRGDLSDEIIKICIPFSSAVISVQSGNKDNLFSILCEQNNIPFFQVGTISESILPLQKIFH